MKKILIAVIAVAVIAAGGLGYKYYADYYKGIPKDAEYYDEFVPRTAAEAPEGLTTVGTAVKDGNEYDIYAFIGEDGSMQRRMLATKNTYASSAVRKTTFDISSENGLIKIPEDATEENIFDSFTGENFIGPNDKDMSAGTAKAAPLYASDEDVEYSVESTTEGKETEVLDGDVVAVTENGTKEYFHYGFLKDSKQGAFFPCDENGNMIPGALSTSELFIQCKLAGTDTILETEPLTEEAAAKKEALIEEHRTARLEEEARIAAEKAAQEAAEKAAKEAAEKAAKEAEERAAREAAERAAAEKAAKEAAERAAKEAADKAAKEAAEKAAAEGKSQEEIDNAAKEAAEKAAKENPYSSQPFYVEKNLDRYIAYGAANPTLNAYSVVANVNSNIDRPFYTGIQQTDLSKGYLMICNKYYQLPAGYAPALELLGDGYGSGYMEPTAAAAFRQMVDAARAEGIYLWSVSPFRSYDTQNALYHGYAARDGYANADRYSARPGHSEHQTGLAVDINNVSAAFQYTKEYAWLKANSYKYGFFERYPAGKEYLTGYMYESWHFRYVGVQNATAIVSMGLTYEEYYAFYLDK